MKTRKDIFLHSMYLIGLRKTIPAGVVNSVQIIENHEPLVDIKQDSRFFFGGKLIDAPKIFLRNNVYKKLLYAIDKLPQNHHFKIYSAFRSVEEQKYLWDREYARNKQENPSMSEDQLIKLTKSFCADPRNGFGGHQTGGAVDISLCDKNGIDYDMGTKYSQKNDYTYTKAKGISPESMKNRKILLNALTSVGLVNYPGEWWHFCYGDKMWAAYKGLAICSYGAINEK
ncbi:MAG: D-alanyl-D-alanine carboxypeptidase family protein [Alphaproteobacteria bacterium]|nr:D-alanyl-D-alanine carboxypeptidase family protein [Alphaproteobacteria bacterium]MCL2889841.1 D-alanyl-D-alanine carboxypeptidase family protein [Alphaproteobacteria bacterium]